MSICERLLWFKRHINKKGLLDPFDHTLSLEQTRTLSPEDQIRNGFAVDMAKRGLDPQKHKQDINNRAGDAMSDWMNR